MQPHRHVAPPKVLHSLVEVIRGQICFAEEARIRLQVCPEHSLVWDLQHLQGQRACVENATLSKNSLWQHKKRGLPETASIPEPPCWYVNKGCPPNRVLPRQRCAIEGPCGRGISELLPGCAAWWFWKRCQRQGPQKDWCMAELHQRQAYQD